MKRSPLILAAPLLASPLALHAETLYLDPIQVTASRVAQTADAALASVTVIERDTIDRLQAHDLAELLSRSVGLTLSSNGGPGKESSLFLRGSEADHLLLLVDGVRVGSVTSGKPALASLPLDQIERIEIVRGPRSSLYGSEAIGGVVQLFTRRGGDGLRPTLSLSAGSEASRRLTAGLSGGDAQTWYSLAAQSEQTDGHDVYTAPATAWSPDEPDADGYRGRSLSLRVGQRLGKHGELELSWLRGDAKSEFDGGYVNESEGLEEVGGVRLTLDPDPLWRTTLQLGLNRDEVDSYKDGVYMSRFNTRRTSATWQNEFTLGESHLLLVGLDELRDTVDSDTAYSVTHRRTHGAFAQLQGEYGATSLQMSLREDDNDQFGSATTGSLAWGYRLHEGLRLSASAGTAYKAPSFNELYYPGYGTSTLQPEEAQSLEFGVDGSARGMSWSLHAYRSEVSHLITTVCDASWVCRAQNVERARLSGIEYQLSRLTGPWRYGLGLTLQDPRSRGGANADKRLPRRAQGSLTFDLDYQHETWDLGATLAGEGRRYDNADNSVELPAYATLDLRAQQRLGQDWRIGLKLANVTDKAYATAAWYPQPGRQWLLTLDYRPHGG